MVELFEKRPAGERRRLVRQGGQLGRRLASQPGDPLRRKGRLQRQLRRPGERPVQFAGQTVDRQPGGFEAGQPVELDAPVLGLLEDLPPVRVAGCPRQAPGRRPAPCRRRVSARLPPGRQTRTATTGGPSTRRQRIRAAPCGVRRQRVARRTTSASPPATTSRSPGRVGSRCTAAARLQLGGRAALDPLEMTPLVLGVEETRWRWPSPAPPG